MQTKMEFNEDEFKDPRHWQDINPDRRYLAKEVAAILRCSESMVYKLRYLGELKWVSVGSVVLAV